MKKIVSYFLQGLLYLVPLAVTIYIIIEAIIRVDGWVPVKIPGLGFVIILASVTVVGFLGSTFLSNQIFNINKLLEKIPLLKIIYTSVKDLLSAFVGKKKRFTEPVLVKMEGNVERIGFITLHDLSDLGITGNKVGVYIPFSYAITGNFIIVPKENVTPIQGKSTDIMKFIISGGVSEIEEENKV